ncbi:MAG: hypothetical protein WAW23_08750 [Candidatus Methanoperedens sp.]
MNEEIGTKDWKTFSNWERTYKKKALKALTIESAFAIFSDLWNAQAGFPAKEIELFRKRKMDELLKLRKSFDLIQKRSHV